MPPKTYTCKFSNGEFFPIAIETNVHEDLYNSFREFSLIL